MPSGLGRCLYPSIMRLRYVSKASSPSATAPCSWVPRPSLGAPPAAPVAATGAAMPLLDAPSPCTPRPPSLVTTPARHETRSHIIQPSTGGTPKHFQISVRSPARLQHPLQNPLLHSLLQGQVRAHSLLLAVFMSSGRCCCCRLVSPAPHLALLPAHLGQQLVAHVVRLNPLLLLQCCCSGLALGIACLQASPSPQVM